MEAENDAQTSKGNDYPAPHEIRIRGRQRLSLLLATLISGGVTMAKKRQRIITPQDLSRMVAALYPADRWKAKPPSFRFDFTRIQHGDIVGICLDWSSRT